jgi:hypothetical protein
MAMRWIFYGFCRNWFLIDPYPNRRDLCWTGFCKNPIKPASLPCPFKDMFRAQCEKTQEFPCPKEEETCGEAPCDLSTVRYLSFGQTCPQATRRFFLLPLIYSVADPDPGSGIGCFLTPGSGIPDPGWENVSIRIRDPGWTTRIIFL